MTFTIVGTGNIAWFFSKRIMAAGHKCMGVFGRNMSKTKELADALLCERSGTIDTLDDEMADICFLAVSDKALSEVTSQLNFTNTILVHMSGATPMSKLQVAASNYGVLWPIYSIQKGNTPSHRNIPTAWEANTPKAKRFILEMGHALTDQLFEAKQEQRQWLHLSAVMTNNFINHLMAMNEQICTENNLPVNTLMPLIEQTFEKIKGGSPKSLQTGPAIRKDDATIESQIALLENKPHFKQVYEAITASIKHMYND